MSCPVPAPICDNFIDYSNIIIDERILPFQFELDPDLSVLNPPAGENQRFCYRVTGVGEDNSTYVDLSHWVLSLCPTITRDQIVNISVTIGGVLKRSMTKTWNYLYPRPVIRPPGVRLEVDFEIAKVLGAEGSTGLFCLN